jgi:L-malate glycosyltransferase
MKILMLTSWYPDRLSSNSGIFIQNQARALAKEHEVTVISAKVDYKKFGLCSFELEETNAELVREFRIIIRRSLPLYNQLNHLLITYFVSRKIVLRNRPEIIHASVGFPGAFLGLLLAKLLRCPFIFTEHTRVSNNFRSSFHKLVTLFALRRADKLVAVSSALAGELKKWSGQEVTIVPNMIYDSQFAQVRISSGEVPQIGFLGGMNTDVKGLDILMKALAVIDQDFVFHIGGTGSREGGYRALATDLKIADKCRFYGFIQPADLPAFMAKLNFFVCSSRYETFCVALIEAMASGLPVVSTRCGGPEDFINSTNGILCDKESVTNLSEAVLWMMKNYTTFNSDLIRRYVSERFSPDAFVRQMTGIYSKALKEKIESAG